MKVTISSKLSELAGGDATFFFVLIGRLIIVGLELHNAQCTVTYWLQKWTHLYVQTAIHDLNIT